MANAVNSIARSVGQALGSTVAVTLIAAGFDPATGFPREIAFTQVALIGAVASVAVLVVGVVGLLADRRHGTGRRPDPLAPVEEATAARRRVVAGVRHSLNRYRRVRHGTGSSGEPQERLPDARPTRRTPWPEPPARTAAPRTTRFTGNRRRRPRARRPTRSAAPAPTTPRPAPTRSRPTGGTIKRTLKEFSEDNLTDWAAALTYYGVLALFPALIALLSIIGLLTDPQTLTDALTAVVPASAADDAQPGHRADRRQHQRRRLRPDPRSRRRHLVGVGLRRRLHPGGQRRLRDARRPQDLEAQAAAAAGHPDRHPVRRRHRRDAGAQRPGRRRHRPAIGIGETGQTVWNIVKWPVAPRASWR